MVYRCKKCGAMLHNGLQARLHRCVGSTPSAEPAKESDMGGWPDTGYGPQSIDIEAVPSAPNPAPSYDGGGGGFSGSGASSSWDSGSSSSSSYDSGSSSSYSSDGGGSSSSGSD